MSYQQSIYEGHFDAQLLQRCPGAPLDLIGLGTHLGPSSLIEHRGRFISCGFSCPRSFAFAARLMDWTSWTHRQNHTDITQMHILELFDNTHS